MRLLRLVLVGNRAVDIWALFCHIQEALSSDEVKPHWPYCPFSMYYSPDMRFRHRQAVGKLSFSRSTGATNPLQSNMVIKIRINSSKPSIDCRVFCIQTSRRKLPNEAKRHGLGQIYQLAMRREPQVILGLRFLNGLARVSAACNFELFQQIFEEFQNHGQGIAFPFLLDSNTPFKFEVRHRTWLLKIFPE